MQGESGTAQAESGTLGRWAVRVVPRVRHGGVRRPFSEVRDRPISQDQGIDQLPLIRRKGESMAEEGTLSIVKRGNVYHVRYASNNPHAQDRAPHACHDEAALQAFLHHLGTDVVSMHQTCAALRKGGVAILPIVLSLGQIQAFFRPTTS
jgi:hypothetical protein